MCKMYMVKLTYSQRKTFTAVAYIIIPQMISTPISRQQLMKLAPSKEILRIALLKCVSGRMLQNPCSHFGKTLTGKNVPANKNCGSVNIFAKGGMVLSFLATLLTTKPKPMKTISAIKLNSIISRKVEKPRTSVKLNAAAPSPIIIMAVSI